MTKPLDFLTIGFSRPALRRCLPTAAVVGTILSAINQGSVILGGDATTSTWVRVLFNYVTPYIVATIGFVTGIAARDRADESDLE